MESNTYHSWQCRVLQEKIPDPLILAPQLLWDYNKNLLHKNILSEQVSKDADQITSTVQSLACEVRKLHGEVQSVQSQQACMATSQAKLFNSITNLDQCIASTQQAFLVQSQEIWLRSKISNTETQISSLYVALLFTTEAKRKAEI